MSGGDTEHLMAVETSFFKSAVLMCDMILKVNYFAANKGKWLACTVFVKVKMIFLCVYVELQIIYFQMIFCTVL